jgi:hypothetical protein
MADEFEEYSRHYFNGWGRIKLNGAMSTVRVLSFDAGGGEPTARIGVINARKEFNEYKERLPLGNFTRDVEWLYPESKYINTTNFVVRCAAYPSRQYSKALTTDNCYFADAIPFKFGGALGEALVPNIYDILDNYVNPYPTYSSCIEALSGGVAVARAFAKRFLVVAHPECPYPLLVHKNSLIGYDRGDVILCSPKAEKLADTLMDLTKKGVALQ